MVRPWRLPELGRVARRLAKVRSWNFSDDIRVCRKMTINVTHKHYYKLEASKVHSVGVVALMLEVVDLKLSKVSWSSGYWDVQ